MIRQKKPVIECSIVKSDSTKRNEDKKAVQKLNEKETHTIVAKSNEDAIYENSVHEEAIGYLELSKIRTFLNNNEGAKKCSIKARELGVDNA